MDIATTNNNRRLKVKNRSIRGINNGTTKNKHRLNIS
jgi:hypothetical protein